MRVLLDECVDIRLVEYMVEVDVTTVAAQGWGGVSNGQLLALAEQVFDIFVTVDRGLSFQQNLPKFDLAVILLVARSNRVADLLPLVPRLLDVLGRAPKGTVTRIEE